MLERSYYDPGRESDIQNSIFATWKISFDEISKQNPQPADLLSLMATLDGHSIPDVLFRKKDERKIATDAAIGMLKAFYLITEGERNGVFRMHRLVQLSTQRWLELQHRLADWQAKALESLTLCCPFNGDYTNWTTWETLSAHIHGRLRI